MVATRMLAENAATPCSFQNTPAGNGLATEKVDNMSFHKVCSVMSAQERFLLPKPDQIINSPPDLSTYRMIDPPTYPPNTSVLRYGQ